MAESTGLKYLAEFSYWVIYDFCDQRVANWPLVPNPIWLILITIVYLVIILRGPHWMKHREPFQLRSFMTVYNLFMVLLSAYMTYEIFVTTVGRPRSEFSMVCQKMDYSDHPESVRLARAIWLYYISKIIEYLDTILFVLRKKNNQISFLHVYHHCSMAAAYWLATTYGAGGEAAFPAMVNSLIHVLMYTYYLLAGLGPRYHKYIWWKKYMTIVQMIQFITIMTKTFIAIRTNCGYPAIGHVVTGFLTPTIAMLFVNFYRQAYSHKRAPLPAAKDVKDTTINQLNGMCFPNGVSNVSNGVSHAHSD